MPKPNKLVYSGLFITCSCLLVAEILLTRVFSVCMWYHFAFFVISIAMFGLGLGSLCVQLCPKFFSDEKLTKHLAISSVLLALTSLIAPFFLFKTNFLIEIFSDFTKEAVLFLTIAFLLSSLPFFFGGLITSLLFKSFPKDISKLYFIDLVGASLGCLLAIPLLEFFGAGTTILLNAALASVGAFLFFCSGTERIFKRSRPMFVLMFVFFSLFSLALINRQVPFFDVRYAKGINRSSDEFSKWNSISRVAVQAKKSDRFIRYTAENVWGVSKKISTTYPDIRILDIDADAGTLLTNFKNDFEAVRYVSLDPSSIVHRLKTNPSTLVIGAGGGKDVLAALSFGAQHVTAVELNPIIVNDVMSGKYLAFSGGLYQNPKVTAVADEGRNFVASHKKKYDIIQLSFVDTSAATSGGAYALAENNLYTTESFVEYLNHLREDGIFSVSWISTPGFDGGARLVSLSVAALEKLGIKDIGANIIVVTYAPRHQWNIHDVLLKLKPFTNQEQEVVLSACETLGFKAFYIPKKDKQVVDFIEARDYKDVLKCLINNSAQRELIYSGWPLNIRPTTDDSPFFFYQKHSKEMSNIVDYIVYTSASKVLNKVLFIGFFMVCFFYCVPLLLSLRFQKIMPYRKSEIVPFLGFFSCIGMGFMLLENILLQKLLLFLGHPVYSLSVTLLSVLFFAGLGSLYTQRLKTLPLQSYIVNILLILLLSIILNMIFLPMIFKFFMGHHKIVKIFIAVISLFPVSFLMGMPLPLAIKILNVRFKQIIPWMWGVNGAASVLASIISIVLAMNIGYDFTFFVGAIFYVTALLFAYKGFFKHS